MAYPMGEADKGALRLDFDRRLMLQFRGSTITSDAGLLAYRQLDDALSLTDTGADMLADARTGKNDRHRLSRAAQFPSRAAGILRPYRCLVPGRGVAAGTQQGNCRRGVGRVRFTLSRIWCRRHIERS
jgi:hypothetical protein